jgi:hypothetical membrane protein
MQTARPAVISIRLTSRRLGALALVSIGCILAGTVVTALPYRGYAGEGYSPLNHFISELGEIGASRLAWAFNLGIVTGGMGLGAFLVLLSRRLDGRFRAALAAVAVVSGVCGTLVGVFPMDYLSVHRIVSMGFFLSGWIVASIFSLWLLGAERPGFPRWLVAPAVLVVGVSWIFIGVYATYAPSNPDAHILSRPDVWNVPALEWASLLSLLFWQACVAVTLLRRGDGAP